MLHACSNVPILINLEIHVPMDFDPVKNRDFSTNNLAKIWNKFGQKCSPSQKL
jgi:hypothetical protein